MSAFPPTISPTELTDFLLAVRHKVFTKDPTDIITPRYPVFMRLESGKYNAVIEEPPGQGPVRDIYYQTEDRITELSASVPQQPRDYRSQENNTRAQYFWIQCISTLLVPSYEYDNCQTPDALVSLIMRKKKGVDKSHRNKQVSYLWNGRTIGSEKLFGLADVLRFTPTSDPSRGAVGMISVDDLPSWTNKSKNYATAYKVYDTGAQTTTFLNNGSNSLSQLWSDLGYNDQDVQEAYPDLMPCNSPFYRCCEDLVTMRQMSTDVSGTQELGVSAISYKSASVFEDRNVPDDPNDSTYGVCALLNSNAWNVVYAQGIRNEWGAPVVLQGDTAIAWDKKTQMTIAYEDLGRLGLLYGVIPTPSVS